MKSKLAFVVVAGELIRSKRLNFVSSKRQSNERSKEKGPRLLSGPYYVHAFWMRVHHKALVSTSLVVSFGEGKKHALGQEEGMQLEPS